MVGLSEAEAREVRQAQADQAQRRAELRKAAEDAVVQWRWAGQYAGLHHPQPLYRERYGLGPPKLLDEAPSTPGSHEQYGIDANGEIVLVREYVEPGEFREELRLRHGDRVVGYRWIETAEPAEINIARYEGERLQSYLAVWPQMLTVTSMPSGSTVERYVWDGDRLSEITVEIEIALDGMPATTRRSTIRPSYDADGRLLELREHSDQGEKVLYRSRRKAPSLAARHRPVEDRLVKLLPRLVAEHADEPIYAVALHYHSEWPLPPNVALGLERDRRGWMQSIDDPETLWYTVWNPAEFSGYDGEGLGGGSLTALDSQLATAIAEIPDNDADAPQQGRKALNRVAKRLQELDWRSIAPVTDDFVVYAVDLELTDLADNLRASVSASLRNKLAARGLLGT